MKKKDQNLGATPRRSPVHVPEAADSASHVDVYQRARDAACFAVWRATDVNLSTGHERLIRAAVIETLKVAIAFVKERGDIENHIVAPGMWFAAGWMRHELLEPLIGTGNQAAPVSLGSLPSAAPKGSHR